MIPQHEAVVGSTDDFLTVIEEDLHRSCLLSRHPYIRDPLSANLSVLSNRVAEWFHSALLFLDDFGEAQPSAVRKGDPCVPREAASRARSLHDEQLRLRRIPLLAVREFPGEVETFQEALPSRELTGLSRGLARLRRKDRLPDADLGDLRRFQEELGELLIHDGLDDPLDLGVSEFHLRLSLELRLGDLETENRRQSLAGVVALEALALLQVLVVLRVLDEDPRKPGLESDEMGPAFDRVDIVDEREDRFVVAIVILHRDLDEGSVGLLRELDRIRMERILRAVDPLDILGDASLELEHIPAVVDLIHNDDPKAGVQECQLPQACRQDVVVEFDGFEDLRIRKESDDRPGAFRRSDDLEVRGLLAAREPHPVFLAVPLHADLEPFAQTIDDGETDAVQPAGHAVHLPFELPAAVHPRQDDLDSRRAVLRVDVDRDPATVICHRDGSVRVQGDLDLLAEAGHRLVERVVDDLVDQVVEAARVDRADVHRRPLSDRLQAFEDLNLRGVVGGLFYHLFRNLSERVSVPSSSPSRGTVQVYGRLL